MLIKTINLTTMMFSGFIIKALFILIAFRVLNLFKARLPFAEKTKRIISYSLPLLELIVWFGFVLYMAAQFYQNESYFALIALCTMVFLSVVTFFSLFRDFVIGVFFKIQNFIVEGSYLEIDGVKGVLTKVGHFHLIILDKQDNSRSYSYYNLRTKAIVKQSANQNLEKVNLQFVVPEGYDISNMEVKLKKALLNTPWTAVSKPPIVENVRSENGKQVFIASVYCLNVAFAAKVKDNVEYQLFQR